MIEYSCPEVNCFSIELFDGLEMGFLDGFLVGKDQIDVFEWRLAWPSCSNI